MSCHQGCCPSSETCIRRVPIFDSLPDNQVALLHGLVESRRYQKGEYIFQEGEPSNALFVISEGVVKVSKLSETGKEHILRFLFSGDFDGQFALFKEGLHYSTAEALEDTVVCRIYREDLKAVLERNPQMAYHFLAAMSDRLRDADEWVGAISLLDVERRLAKTLLIFGRRHGELAKFELPVAKKDFAALIGVAPETLSRKLTFFESQHFIALSGKKGIQILNPGALRRVAGEDV